MNHNKLHIATILGPHGIRGQVRVRSMLQEAEDLFSYHPVTDETSKRVFKMKMHGEKKGEFIASIDGVSTRNDSEALKGVKLFIDRALLPDTEEDEYYLADLIGLEARDEKENVLGVVDSTHDYGAGVFLEIKPQNGKSFMLPFKNEFVPVVDIEKGFLTAILPDDWLKEEKQK